MSEKHLTEVPWKTLAVKQGVKDLGLGKALAAYGSLDAIKEPAKALDALKEITELAVKLKKANSTKEEVVAHLDEVLKEVKKTTPALDARLKSAAGAATAADAKTAAAPKPAQDEDEEQDVEAKAVAAFTKDLKKQMMSALAQVRSRAPGDPEQEKEPKPQLEFMAYLVAKSPVVVVALKVGAATRKLLPEIAGVPSGGKFVKGLCIFEKNAHTFLLDEVPGGLAKKLATAIHAETGQKYKVRVRSLDGSVTLDSDTDVDPEAAPVATPAPAPPSSGPDLTALAAQLKALVPRLKEAIAADPAKADALRSGAKAAQEAIAAGQLPAAQAALGKLTDLLVEKTSAVATGPDAAALSAQLKALVPRIKEAMAADPARAAALRSGAKAAQEAIAGGQLAAAQAALEKLSGLLGAIPAGGAARAGAPKAGAQPRPAEQVLPVWREAKELVGEQLTKMQAAMRAHSSGVVRSVAEMGLHAITDGAQVGLQTSLMAFDSADEAGKVRAAPAVRKAMAECRSFLQSHPALPLLEQNPLQVTFTVRKSWGAALDQIETTLGSLEPASVANA